MVEVFQGRGFEFSFLVMEMTHAVLLKQENKKTTLKLLMPLLISTNCPQLRDAIGVRIFAPQ